MSDERVIVEHRSQRGVRGVSWAIILIGFGVAFLLQNLGVMSFNWLTLVRYWPVLLILGGIDLLLGRTWIGSAIAALLGLVIVGGLLYMASSAGGAVSLTGPAVTQDIPEYALDDSVEELTVNLSVGAASVILDGNAARGQVVQGTYRADENIPLETEYSSSGDTGVLTLKQETEGAEWVTVNVENEINVSLAGDVPLVLNADSGASNLEFDLSDVQLRVLNVNGGVGNLEVQLPAQGDMDVNVNGGIGAVSISVPNGLEAEVRIDGLTSMDVPARFDKISDGLWRTSGYEDAENRARITISTGIGRVEIR